MGTFSPKGTFQGAAERLDHLVDLGVNAVELMPVAEFAGGRGWATMEWTSSRCVRPPAGRTDSAISSMPATAEVWG